MKQQQWTDHYEGPINSNRTHFVVNGNYRSSKAHILLTATLRFSHDVVSIVIM